MAKTLIIKGASFGTNKVTAVSFGGSVPCTGIAITESSITATDYDPIELEYEVSPSNTTDSISWTSSDTSVATVDNGVVTPVGIGTATITATCGSYSDTVSVTVAFAAILDFELGMLSNQQDTFVMNTGSVTNRVIVFGSGAQKTEYLIADGSAGYLNRGGVKLPNNTASLTVAFSTVSGLYNGDNVFIYWLKDESCGSTLVPNAAKLVREETGYNARSNASKAFSIPEGADAMVMFFRLTGNATGTADEAATAVGFSLTFSAT